MEHKNYRKRRKKGTDKTNTGEKRIRRRKMNIACKYLQVNHVDRKRKLHQVSEENTKRNNGHKQRKEKFRLKMSKKSLIQR